MEIKTVGNVVSLLAAMLDWQPLAGHAAGLIGARTRGSTTKLGLADVDPSIALEEFDAGKYGMPGCTYLRASIPALEGRMGAVTLGSLEEQPVGVRKGAHGYELFIDVSPELAQMPATDEVTFVLGSDDSGSPLELILWTWHPGPVMSSSKQGLCDDTAVKVHNG